MRVSGARISLLAAGALLALAACASPTPAAAPDEGERGAQ